jgi:hypothetical protein
MNEMEMSMEANLQDRNSTIVQRAIDGIWNQGDLDLADCLFDSTYVNHGGLITSLVHGPESIKISVALLRTAFPDLTLTIEQFTATGNTVEVCWAAEAQSRSWTSGSKQGGRMTGTTLTSLLHGKIIESWTDWDGAQAFQRLEYIRTNSRA